MSGGSWGPAALPSKLPWRGGRHGARLREARGSCPPAAWGAGGESSGRRCPRSCARGTPTPSAPSRTGEAAAGTPEGAGAGVSGCGALCRAQLSRGPGPGLRTRRPSRPTGAPRRGAEVRGSTCPAGGTAEAWPLRALTPPWRSVGGGQLGLAPARPVRRLRARRLCSRPQSAASTSESRRLLPLALLRPLPSPSLPGMVGRWHARLCQAPPLRQRLRAERRHQAAWLGPHGLRRLPGPALRAPPGPLDLGRVGGGRHWAFTPSCDRSLCRAPGLLLGPLSVSVSFCLSLFSFGACEVMI